VGLSLEPYQIRGRKGKKEIIPRTREEGEVKKERGRGGWAGLSKIMEVPEGTRS